MFGAIVLPIFVWFFGGGVLCAVIARSRGRDPLTWFLLGAFFFVFAIIAVIALPPVGESREGTLRSAGSTTKTELLPLPDKACPRCAEIIRGAAVACRFCGYEYPADEAEKIRENATAARSASSADAEVKGRNTPLGPGDRVFVMGDGSGTIEEILGEKARVAFDRGRTKVLELYWLHRARPF